METFIVPMPGETTELLPPPQLIAIATVAAKNTKAMIRDMLFCFRVTISVLTNTLLAVRLETGANNALLALKFYCLARRSAAGTWRRQISARAAAGNSYKQYFSTFS
jgi:hypothetical protein